MKTPHIFLDANVFIGQGYQYGSTAFRQIISLAQAQEIFVYLTDITIREVEANITKDLYKAHQTFEGQRNRADIRILKSIIEAPLHGLFNGFDAEQAKEVLITQFRKCLEDMRVRVLYVSQVSIDDIFSKYFAKTPPFGEGDKKAEFPDAFALAALEAWCKEYSERLYVISADGDMISACSESQMLRSVPSLPEFLDLLTKGEELAEIANQIFEAHREEITQHIKSAAQYIHPYYEPYGEVQYTYINGVEILKHYLLEVEGTKAVFEIMANISYSAQVRYRNYAIGMMMGGMGVREELEHRTTTVKAEVSIGFNKDNSEEFSVEYANVRNQDILIYPHEDPEDFIRKSNRAQEAFQEHAPWIIEMLGGVDWVINSTPEAVIKQFDTVKESVPTYMMLDLQTLQQLNSYNSGLNYQGAMTIKSRAEAIKRLENKKPSG
jgi:PIN domain